MHLSNASRLSQRHLNGGGQFGLVVWTIRFRRMVPRKPEVSLWHTQRRRDWTLDEHVALNSLLKLKTSEGKRRMGKRENEWRSVVDWMRWEFVK